MVRWLGWHCPPDTGFEIRALAVWGRARYLSVTEAPHNTDFHTWMGKKHFCFFQTAETGNRTPNSGVKGSGANHYPRAPAQAISNHFESIWPCCDLEMTLPCPWDNSPMNPTPTHVTMRTWVGFRPIYWKCWSNNLFSPILSWFDLAVTFTWPCHDIEVTTLWNPTPTDFTMYTWARPYQM